MGRDTSIFKTVLYLVVPEIEIIKQRLKLEGYREEVLREAKMDVGYLVQCDVDKFLAYSTKSWQHR